MKKKATSKLNTNTSDLVRPIFEKLKHTRRKKGTTPSQHAVALEHKKMREEARKKGCTLMKDLQRGRNQKVLGRVVSILIPPAQEQKVDKYGVDVARIPHLSGLQGFTVTISDGTDQMLIIFMGRKMILGILPGSVLEVEGYIAQETTHTVLESTFASSQKVLYNPKYAIITENLRGHPQL